MTIDEVKLHPPEAAEAPPIVENDDDDAEYDDRFVRDEPKWLRLGLDRGPHRPWIWLADSKHAARLRQALVPVNLVLFFVLTRLNAALMVLHEPGDNGHGIRALGASAREAAAAVTQWRTVGAELADYNMLRNGVTGTGLATAHTLFGVAFALAWPSAFALTAVWLRQELEGVAGSARAQPARKMLGVSLLAVPYIVLTGVLLNLGRLAVVKQVSPARLAPVLRLVTLVDAAAILGCAIPMIVGLAVLKSTRCVPVRGLFRGLVLVRIQVVTLVTFALLLVVVSTKDQAQDLLRSWQKNPRWALWGVLAMIAFAAATAVSAAKVLAVSRNKREPAHSLWSLVGVGAALVAVGLILQFGLRAGGVGCLVAGIGIVVIGLLSQLIQGEGAKQAQATTAARPTVRPSSAEGDEAAVWPTLAAILGAIPLVVMGVAAVLALIPELLGPGPRPVMLIVVAIVFFGSAVAAYLISRHFIRMPEPNSEAKFLTRELVERLLIPAAVIAAGLSGWISFNPGRAGWELGAIAIVGFFLAGVMVVVMLLATFAHRYSPPAALSILGFRRTPVLLLFVIWGLLGMAVDRDSPLHDARIVNGATHQTFNVNTYTDQWIARQAADGFPATATPLVFVSAAGGGIKAAAWTASVLHCTFEPRIGEECPLIGDPPSDNMWDSVFAVSGASGGTVGLASVLAERLVPPTMTPKDKPDYWVKKRLGTDLASATIGWQLFEEAPLTLFRARPGKRDRAEILEDAWSRQWRDVTDPPPCGGEANPTRRGMFELFGNRQDGDCPKRLPLFFPNGTSLRDGCRFNGSILDGVPQPPEAGNSGGCTRGQDVAARAEHGSFVVTRDLADFLCSDEDVPLATAAFLSARFPFVSPTGRLTGPAKRGRGDDGLCNPAADKGTVFVGDGGYRDNTGSSVLLELWDRVHRRLRNQHPDTCVVPIFVQINSGYENRSAVGPSERLIEGIAPLTGAVTVFGARDKAGPQLARSGMDHFLEFSLRAHPAVQAPLGWSLSESATEDFEHQMNFEDNKSQLKRLRSLLTPGGVHCSGG